MAQHSKTAVTSPAAASPAVTSPAARSGATGSGAAAGSRAGSAAGGFGTWSKGRKIYLAVGILACLAGVLMMALSR